MKKVFMMLVLFVVPFAMQAQTFHDVEANDAKGPVKSITTSMMGQSQTITFTQDGKQEGLNKAVYDDNGYLQSAEQDNQMGTIKVTYKWENGKIKSQSMDMMGQQMPMNYVYNEKGELIKQTMSMMGQDMVIEHSDYKYDDHGNWISRKTSVMGQSMESPRTIVYY
ncbi:MAG: hypothetical protein J5548_05980 [Prevotella sp.]|nr:hypothetical protein [Prevotella sp.]